MTLELEGQSPRTYQAGEAFAQRPDLPHSFRNVSTIVPARALGVEIAARGQPLQY
jgi:hypothetical protein